MWSCLCSAFHICAIACQCLLARTSVHLLLCCYVVLLFPLLLLRFRLSADLLLHDAAFCRPCLGRLHWRQGIHRCGLPRLIAADEFCFTAIFMHLLLLRRCFKMCFLAWARVVAGCLQLGFQRSILLRPSAVTLSALIRVLHLFLWAFLVGFLCSCWDRRRLSWRKDFMFFFCAWLLLVLLKLLLNLFSGRFDNGGFLLQRCCALRQQLLRLHILHNSLN
mmetsp:Transcript_21552/g.50243  ORF Transcript_21552/g.50243 Transcript_21552/m.50243 type:complete len:220 (-) Transcript_21552:1159-1818(-)